MTKNTILKRKVISCFSIALLFSAPVVLSQNMGGNIAQAQAQNPSAKKSTSVKVPAMRNRVYTQLARAQKLADEGNGLEGFDVLDEVQDRIDSLNSYERAMFWNFYGFMYYGNDDIASAIDSFEKVVNEKAIPSSLRLSTLYSLAQLSMQLQNFDQSLKFLGTWKENNPKEMTNTQQVLFAQVHSQNKQYKQSLSYVSKAIEQSETANEVPKENWLILQRASYFQLKQTIDVTRVIENLVRYYNKPKYWLQLSAMYGEIGEEEKQLAVMESKYEDNSKYFKDFFFNSSQYQKYATAPTGSAEMSETYKVKQKKNFKVTFIISVNVDELRKKLEFDQIIESFGFSDVGGTKPTIMIFPSDGWLEDNGYSSLSRIKESKHLFLITLQH